MPFGTRYMIRQNTTHISLYLGGTKYQMGGNTAGYGTSEGDSKVPDEREKLFEEVRSNLSAAYQRHAKTYNLRSNTQCASYAVGEKVLKQTFDLSDKGKGFCKKLAPKHEPAVVRKVLGSNT